MIDGTMKKQLPKNNFTVCKCGNLPSSLDDYEKKIEYPGGESKTDTHIVTIKFKCCDVARQMECDDTDLMQENSVVVFDEYQMA